ncbi:MAG: L-threonylcarbamoyladenylate synthase [Muribaculaceae bacterium]|nr:L-threonylcarbamoyladenylate synthase [Muribaculaceae bacterium]
MRQEIERAAKVVRQGGIVLYPTDTVWGIGCDATNPEAVARVYQLKRRADHKAMIVLVDSAAMVERYADGVPEVAYELIEVTDRPLTLVYDRGVGLAENLLGPDGSVGIRVTSEEFSQGLCRRLHRPLVSTSANISGEPAARCFADISEEVRLGVDYIVDWRRDELPGARQPSSVMRITASGEFKVLRK